MGTVSMFWTEQGGLAVTLKTCIHEVLNLNLGQDAIMTSCFFFNPFKQMPG
jgi:hypothetical protein